MPDMEEVNDRMELDERELTHVPPIRYKSKKKKTSKKKTPKMCHKWEHDFSYEGKKKHRDIVCRDCGKNMVEWIYEREEEFNRKFEGMNPYN